MLDHFELGLVSKMENFHKFCVFLHPILIISLFLTQTNGQLAASEGRILVQLQQMLEYPPPLQGWSNWTNFCYLTSTPSLSILCSANHISDLTVIGNTSSPLSHGFSIDSFFTVITKLSGLKVLSLVSLGLWGPLPVKINRFSSLQVLNLSSNFICGAIPPEICWLVKLTSLNLSSNMLNGSVPDLSALPVLEELDLSCNVLGPEIPSLGDKLVGVVLRKNVFRSPIPWQLQNFNHLQHLDMSSNQLVGLIPSSLFSLLSIRYINLSENNLSGALLTNVFSCNDGLEYVDISHNLLIGKVPLCMSNSSNRTITYSYNCLTVSDSSYQHPDSFCHTEALAANPTLQESRNRSSSKLTLVLCIVGALVGCIGAIGILILAVLQIRRVNNDTLEKSFSRKGSSRLSPRLPTEARISPAMRLSAIGLQPYHVFSLEDIKEATNSFHPSTSIGEHSQSQLYKGWIRDGCIVIIQCLKVEQRHSPHSILQHMELISKFRHRHMVSVLGHCIVPHEDYPNATDTVFLVFEYVSNGTLRSYLTDQGKKDAFKWPQRVAVSIGIAKGVEFLHTGITPGIFCNNLKMEHVLLDENLTAKISNYNLPMPFKVSSESPLTGKDTVDHHERSMPNDEQGEKEDIHHLGAIMLELIMGKPITSPSELDRQRHQLEQCLRDIPSKLWEFADHSIHGTFADESLRTTAEITVNCLSANPSQRPSIEDVIWNLQYSVQVQEG